MTLLFVAVGRLFGVVSFSPGPVSSVVSGFGALLLGLIVKNVFEDFAWQGFLMPELVSVGVRDVWVYLLDPLSGVLPLAGILAFGLWLRKKRIERESGPVPVG